MMKNLLKLASAAALSCTFLMAHAQQGDGKMMKKDEKMASGKMADGKTQVKMHDGKMHNGNMTHKATMNKNGKMISKDKM
ncbi:hypothetical protein GCM10011495_10590 [Hymenobacter frigidus]|uniref:Pentapeptide MXKDX repeat protein n=1 Tax=Hymenobacter frigidus TaxID=1524095 RepID=A0ABQ1ZY99_9BACT|nr:hypothetical protein [Hymenobacter frigidus]GGH82411.1 hypothetical protein GCM10011495_10590 [Hymenobacter frigidus]